MNLPVSDQKYGELKKVFSMLSQKQAFIVAAFALERLWGPFAEGISDCPYTEQERQDVLRLEKALLDIVWAHILWQDPRVDRWKEFCALYDQIEELSAEVELNSMAKPFYCAIVDFAGWCLKEERAEGPARARPDLVVGPLDLIMDCVSAKIPPYPRRGTQGILERHPAVLAEIARIGADIQMAEEYPRNVDLILQRRAEYHDLNVSHI